MLNVAFFAGCPYTRVDDGCVMTLVRRLAGFLALCVCAVSCTSSQPSPASASSDASSGDTAFHEVSHAYLEDLYQRQPTYATYLGIHKYNERLDDYSRAAVDDAVTSARQ